MIRSGLMWEKVKLSELEGKIVTSIDVGEDMLQVLIRALTNDGEDTFLMTHHRECCEAVHLVDIHGFPTDLIGSHVISMREDTNEGGYDEHRNVVTWYFYSIETVRSTVVFRWYGSSNGHYSTEVSLFKQVEIPP